MRKNYVPAAKAADFLIHRYTIPQNLIMPHRILILSAGIAGITLHGVDDTVLDLLHDPAIKAFYDRKKAQGKHHYVCVGYICRKLINIIFSVLKSGQPYQPVFPKNLV